MAWRSSASSHAELVANLARNGLLGDDARVRAAFLAVDRADYAPRNPYADAPQGLGHGATISAPHMHALAVRQLAPFVVPDAAAGRAAPRVLDVGAGSGYLTHVLAELVTGSGPGPGTGPGGVVVGIEHVPALCALAAANMGRSAGGRALLAAGRARFVVGDGRAAVPAGPDGAGAGPFDAIHVGAAAAELHPALLDQLRAPGRMFIPLADETGAQHVWTVDKAADGAVTRTRLFGVRYVPLTDAPGETSQC